MQRRAEKDVNYYQCYALTVTDQDFVKTVNVIYKDQFVVPYFTTLVRQLEIVVQNQQRFILV